MKTHKCPNCKARDHRGQYCPPCAAIYRQVRRWVKGDKLASQVTPAGTVWWVVEPSEEVRAWLEERGKMPDLDALRWKAALKTWGSILGSTSS